MRRVFLLFNIGLIAWTGGAHAQFRTGGKIYIGQTGTIAVAGDVMLNEAVEGSGRLLLRGRGAAQQLQMGGHSVAVLEIDNAHGVSLQGDARVRELLEFTSGKVVLGDASLVFEAGAAHAGADPERFILTDGTGRVSALAVDRGAGFIFPVGNAPGDYAQAVVTNHADARDIHVHTGSYAGSEAVVFNEAEGAGKVWKIQASSPGRATLALTHPETSEGASFLRNAAFVTQQLEEGGLSWSIGQGASGNGGYTHEADVELVVSGPQRYFSKSSNTDSSLGRFHKDPSGVGHLAGLNEVKVYPNPFASEVLINITGYTEHTASCVITDMLGRYVAGGVYPVTQNNLVRLGLPELAPGAYLLHVSGTVTKLIKE